MNNFHYTSVLLHQMYGIEMEDADMEELGLIAWGLIGNKNRKLYKYSTYINPADNSVTLPCNALDINGDSCVELVTAPYEDWNRVTNTTDFGDQNTSFVEQYIEGGKLFQGPYYMPGKVLHYEKVGDIYGKINILYKGILADEEGLPELTDKEATAIATYIAYFVKFKEGLKTNNGDIIKMSEILEGKWLKQCDQARVKYLSQSDMDAILEVGASWDRKRFGMGYKPLK